MDMHEKARHVPCTSWPKKCLAGFYSLDLKHLLAQVCLMFRVTIKASTFKNQSVAMVCLPTQDVRIEGAVGHNYKTIVYVAVNDARPGKANGEESMTVSLQDFEKKADHVQWIAKCPNGCAYDFWLVPENFSSLRTNETRPVPGTLTSAPATSGQVRLLIFSFNEYAMAERDISTHDAIKLQT